MNQILAMFGGMSPIAKAVAAGIVGVVASAIKYINTKYHIGIPMPDATFTDWLVTAITAAFVYIIPNAPKPTV